MTALLLAMVAEFLMLSLSGFQAGREQGVLVTLTIVLALPPDFLLFPTLPTAIDRSES